MVNFTPSSSVERADSKAARVIKPVQHLAFAHSRHTYETVNHLLVADPHEMPGKTTVKIWVKLHELVCMDVLVSKLLTYAGRENTHFIWAPLDLI